MVIMRSLFIVVALESSARTSQTSVDARGDSKKVNKDQLIQAALPNMVTYEFKSSLLYFVRLFLVEPVSFTIFSSALLLPEAKNRATDITQSKNQTDK